MGKDKQRRLARARNVVKKWEAQNFNGDVKAFDDITREIQAKRYERACALILADKIANS